MHPKKVVARMNENIQRFALGSGGWFLGADDIAYMLAIWQGGDQENDEQQYARLGSYLIRVKWGGQQAMVPHLIVAMHHEVQRLARRNGWRVETAAQHQALRRAATLALRECGVIRPAVRQTRWQPADAERYTDVAEQSRRCTCGSDQVRQLAAKRHGMTVFECKACNQQVLSRGYRLTRAQRLKWADVANQCSRAGASDADAIALANDVIAGRYAWLSSRSHGEPEWEPGLEMCAACKGTYQRTHGGRVIRCTRSTCDHGHRVWRASDRARAVGLHVSSWRETYEHGRYPDIRGICINVEHAVLERMIERLG